MCGHIDSSLRFGGYGVLDVVVVDVVIVEVEQADQHHHLCRVAETSVLVGEVPL